MTPTELLKTIYLGDRACKGICLDGWNHQVMIHVDVISRVRSSNGTWDFYCDEDIVDGRLVFGEVSAVRFEPSSLWRKCFEGENEQIGEDQGAATKQYPQ